MPKKKPLIHLPCSFRGYNLSHVLGSGYWLTSLLLLDVNSVSTENLLQCWPRLVQIWLAVYSGLRAVTSQASCVRDYGASLWSQSLLFQRKVFGNINHKETHTEEEKGHGRQGWVFSGLQKVQKRWLNTVTSCLSLELFQSSRAAEHILPSREKVLTKLSHLH